MNYEFTQSSFIIEAQKGDEGQFCVFGLAHLKSFITDSILGLGGQL